MLPLMITAIENDDDRQLAAELYTRYRAVMLRRAGSILKEDDRAEEAVQEAMLRVIRHLETVRMIPENERAYYLAAVTQTAALDLYRRRQREQQNTFTGYDESMDAPGPAETARWSCCCVGSRLCCCGNAWPCCRSGSWIS